VAVDRTAAELAAFQADFRRRIEAVISYARSQGIPAVINSGNGRRSMAQHRENVAAGRSWTTRSLHVDGRAADLDLFGYPPDSIPVEYWQWLGAVGEYYGLKWGGRWKSRDWRHFEL
jgi:uncharacterized protein YcbK (DUF882 family)